jgi:hypothetical protein
MKLKESEDEEDLEEESEDSEETDADDGAEPVVETDNVGDPSVEINVEELIHELEVQNGPSRPCKEHAAKRRLEELMERKRAKRELEDFEDYEI